MIAASKVSNKAAVLADIMQPQVVVATPEMSVRTLARLLHDKMISGAPVVDEAGRLVGVVSASDLVGFQAAHGDDAPLGYFRELWLQVDSLKVEADQAVKVSDLMSHHVFQLDENTPLEEAVDLMLDWFIHRIIVTRRGRVAGVVTTMDLLKQLRRLLPGTLR